MKFRFATITDIEPMHSVRIAVKENSLSDPGRITAKDYQSFLEKGKGWVCEIDSVIVGFAIVDLQDKNVWALFVDPMHEGKGIGKKLHDLMMHWYFDHSNETIWLSTSFNTRAEKFYMMQGWTPVGTFNNELKLEMTAVNWSNNCANNIR